MPGPSNIAPPNGLEYLAYLLPKLEFIAKAAALKMIRASNIKKKSYSRI